MGISFAGVGLLLETPEVAAYLRQYHSLERLVELSLGGLPGSGLNHISYPQYREAEPVRVGVLHWPRDCSRSATFHCVVNSTRLQRIREVVDESGPYQQLEIGDGTNEPVQCSMRMLPPRALFAVEGAEQLYLLSLVDQRYDLTHNRPGSVTSTPDSWDELFEGLRFVMGASITVGAVATGYGTPSDRWTLYHRPIAAITDAACTTVGQKFVAQLDGSLATVNWEEALQNSDYQLDLYRKCGGGIIAREDIQRVVPGNVVTVFAQTASGVIKPDPFTITYPLYALNVTGYAGASGLLTNTHSLYADLIYDGTNGVACSSYAREAARDFYGWQLANQDVTFAGIVPWEPTGAEDSIEWTYSLTDPGPRLTTRIQRGPWDGFPTGDYLPSSPGSSSSGGGGDGNCSACGFVEGLTVEDCYSISVDGGKPRSILEGVSLNGVFYTVVFDPEGPSLTLYPEGGSGSGGGGSGGGGPVSGRLDCCSCPCITFVFPRKVFYPNQPVAPSPCDRLLKIKVCVDCCPIEGWDGEGYYCVRPAGTGEVGEPQLLLDEDKCDDEIEITGGRYSDRDEAAALCGPPRSATPCDGPGSDGDELPLGEMTRATIVHNGSGGSSGESCVKWAATPNTLYKVRTWVEFKPGGGDFLPPAPGCGITVVVDGHTVITVSQVSHTTYYQEHTLMSHSTLPQVRVTNYTSVAGGGCFANSWTAVIAQVVEAV